METLIVSKTTWGTLYCVGGIVLQNNQPIRLLDRNGDYQPANTQFEIGDIWNINFQRSRNISAPHYEDVLVQNSTFLRRQNNLVDYLLGKNIPIWRGNPTCLYDGLIQFSNSHKGYIPENGPFPNASVGFWIPANDLTLRWEYEKARYIYQNGNTYYNLPFKGCTDPVEIIEEGSLVRVSLAKIFRPENAPAGFYLQLSGWYTNVDQNDRDDDLPF
jgi:hypothetical protein